MAKFKLEYENWEIGRGGRKRLVKKLLEFEEVEQALQHIQDFLARFRVQLEYKIKDELGNLIHSHEHHKHHYA